MSIKSNDKPDDINCLDHCLTTCARLSVPEETKQRRKSERLSAQVESLILQSANHEFEELENSNPTFKQVRAYIIKYELSIGTKTKGKIKDVQELVKEIKSLLEEYEKNKI